MGRYIRTLIRPCLRQLEGWSSGTRSKASGRAAVGLDQFGTRFLCRSRLTHTISSVMQSPWRDPRSSYVENKKRRWGGPTQRSGSSLLSALEMMAHGCGLRAYPSSWTLRARQFFPACSPRRYSAALLAFDAVSNFAGLANSRCRNSSGPGGRDVLCGTRSSPARYISPSDPSVTSVKSFYHARRWPLRPLPRRAAIDVPTARLNVRTSGA